MVRKVGNDYYIYEYIRLDTNEPFYVGKGKGKRWRVLNRRNRYFSNILKNTPVACIILHDKLDENTALQYECWYIWQLRDIQGYWLVNGTDGGEKGFPTKYKFNNKQLKSISSKLKDRYSKEKHPTSKPIILLDKDNNIFKKFNTIGEYCEGDWRKKFPKPHGRHHMVKCLKTGELFNGYKAIYERDYVK